MAKKPKKVKRDFAAHGRAFDGNGKDVYITTGEGFRVDGGSKETHDHMVELTGETVKRLNKEQPQSWAEAGEILRDVSKKVGFPESR